MKKNKTMTELIKITENNGKKVVSARDLYGKLGFKDNNFSKFCDRYILKNEYAIENTDYQCLVIYDDMPNGGQRKQKEYALNIDFAKKICMLARTEAGEKIRQYFIEVEKKALQPLSESELILRSAQMLVNLERNQKAIEQRLKAIEERPQVNAEVQHFSILGYCNNIHKQISINEAKIYGQKCRRLCNELGMVIGKIADPRFGSVNTYPKDVLSEVIK